LLTSIDTLGRPAPAEDGTEDPRTAGQRRHDALEDALLTAVRSGQLPDRSSPLPERPSSFRAGSNARRQKIASK
jgi:hypothetical protein